MKIRPTLTAFLLSVALFLTACQPPAAAPPPTGSPTVLATLTFLADIAQNVAGDRLKVDALIPTGMDPHSFEPTPSDVVRIANSQILITNGAGFETWLARTLQNAGGERLVITASKGLAFRQPSPSEQSLLGDHPDGDPHFWLDPLNTVTYVENIRAGLIQADPAGKDIYTRNAAAYILKLKDLDTWVAAQIQTIPTANRLMVTNHESFGYYADRYGLRVVGAILPSASTDVSPSAQQLASLIQAIKTSGARAIFLETGSNPQLARQVAAETGIQVIDQLYDHSTTPPNGPAPTYLDMIKYDTQTIVSALR
jgi:ABC-type Zn uptake system ZnuABC Zn-binding protein ZnuA